MPAISLESHEFKVGPLLDSRVPIPMLSLVHSLLKKVTLDNLNNPTWFVWRRGRNLLYWNMEGTRFMTTHMYIIFVKKLFHFILYKNNGSFKFLSGKWWWLGINKKKAWWLWLTRSTHLIHYVQWRAYLLSNHWKSWKASLQKYPHLLDNNHSVWTLV